jgi:Lrp/AsnC family transcriptional regulator, leucine-responsive regulatory protein
MIVPIAVSRQAERPASSTHADGLLTEALDDVVRSNYSLAYPRIIQTTIRMSEDQLDRIDRNILAALSGDARLSMAELAGKVGLSKTPVQARVRRLEKDGYIRGYSAIIDRERMGEGHVAFVQVKLSDTRSLALAEFNRAVQSVAEIEQCHMMAASFDYLLKVRTRDIAAYRRVLGERISALPHVAQTSTFVAMETVKDR